MIEPRRDELNRVYAYWLDKKGQRRAPARADLDPIEIPALMPHLLLLDVESSPRRFRFRLVGTAIVNGLGRDLTGRYLDELKMNKVQRAMFAEYQRVADTAEAACTTWEYTRDDGRHVRLERLVLPLSGDGSVIDMLLVGIVFDAAHG
ncbi:MAG: PAS domain-containing protein [Candidatus Eiseniibacteriota bacterium]